MRHHSNARVKWEVFYLTLAQNRFGAPLSPPLTQDLPVVQCLSPPQRQQCQSLPSAAAPAPDGDLPNSPSPSFSSLKILHLRFHIDSHPHQHAHSPTQGHAPPEPAPPQYLCLQKYIYASYRRSQEN